MPKFVEVSVSHDQFMAVKRVDGSHELSLNAHQQFGALGADPLGVHTACRHFNNITWRTVLNTIVRLNAHGTFTSITRAWNGCECRSLTVFCGHSTSRTSKPSADSCCLKASAFMGRSSALLLASNHIKSRLPKDTIGRH